jgi:hypothetical protein
MELGLVFAPLPKCADPQTRKSSRAGSKDILSLHLDALHFAPFFQPWRLQRSRSDE